MPEWVFDSPVIAPSKKKQEDEWEFDAPVLAEPYKPKPSAIQELGKGIVEGLASTPETVGTLAKIAGAEKVGGAIERAAGNVAKKNAIDESLQGSIVDNPELLKEPAWWTHNIGQVMGSIAGPVGAGGTAATVGKTVLKKVLKDKDTIAKATKYLGIGAAGGFGGAMEGSQTYNAVLQETGDKDKALRAGGLMAVGSAALNSLSFGTMLSKATKNKLAHVVMSGFTEGATEQLEEPWDAVVQGKPDQAVDRWIQGFNVFLPAMIVGGMGGGAGAVLNHRERKEVLDAIEQSSAQKVKTIEALALDPTDDYVTPEEHGVMSQWVKGMKDLNDADYMRVMQDVPGLEHINEQEALHEEARGKKAYTNLTDRLATEEANQYFAEEQDSVDVIRQAAPKAIQAESDILNQVKAEEDADYVKFWQSADLENLTDRDLIDNRARILESRPDVTPEKLNDIIIKKKAKKLDRGIITPLDVIKPDNQIIEPPVSPVAEQPDLLKSAEYILTHNTFKDFELDGYMGKDAKYIPHGIPREIWKQASENVGFEKKNLDEYQNGYSKEYALKAPVAEPERATVPPVAEKATGEGVTQTAGRENASSSDILIRKYPEAQIGKVDGEYKVISNDQYTTLTDAPIEDIALLQDALSEIPRRTTEAQKRLWSKKLSDKDRKNLNDVVRGEESEYNHLLKRFGLHIEDLVKNPNILEEAKRAKRGIQEKAAVEPVTQEIPVAEKGKEPKLSIPTLTLDQVPETLESSGISKDIARKTAEHLQSVLDYEDVLLRGAGKVLDQQRMRSFTKKEIEDALSSVVNQSPDLAKQAESATIPPVTSKKGPGDKTTEATPQPDGGKIFDEEKIDIDDIEWRHSLTHEPSGMSIREYREKRGATYRDPIIISEDNRVIDGAGRLSNEAWRLQHQSVKHVKIIRVPLSYSEIIEAAGPRNHNALLAEISKVVYEKNGYTERAKRIVEETDYAYDDQALELLDPFLPNPSRSPVDGEQQSKMTVEQEAAPTTKTETTPENKTGTSTQKAGYVFIKRAGREAQYPFTEYREITKGKDKGKIGVTVRGREFAVDRSAVKQWPGEVDEQPRASRKENTAPLTSKDVIEALAPMHKKWKNHPDAIVVDSIDKLPNELRDRIEDPDSVQAVFDPKAEKIYYIADKIGSPEEAREVAVHETIKHWGLRKTLGPEFASFMDRVYGYASRSDMATLDKIAKNYGLDLSRAQDRFEAADEYVAHMAGLDTKPPMWNRLVSWVQNWLRKIGLPMGKERANQFIIDAVRASRAYVEEGGFGHETIAEGLRRMVAAWHGSPHTFDKFSKDRIGTGEGAQAYGHGMYFAGKKEVAEYYKDALSSGANYKYKGKIYTRNLKDPNYQVLSHIVRTGKEDTVETYEILAKHEDNVEKRNVYQKQLEFAKSVDEKAIEPYENKGHLYEVDLAPDEDEYLLFDAPLSDLTGSAKSAILEGRPDSISGTSDFLGNLFKSKSFISEGYRSLDVPTQRLVLENMLTATQDAEVLNSIIRLLPVDVMDILARKKLSPDMIFHDEAVLHDLLLSLSDEDISGGVYSSSASLINVTAIATAKNLPASFVDLSSEKAFSAGEADKFWHKSLLELSQYVNTIASKKQDINGNVFYNRIASILGSQELASSYLRSLGIRGIKYLDGASRAKGEGDYNYVIFSDEDVNIKARYKRKEAEESPRKPLSQTRAGKFGKDVARAIQVRPVKILETEAPESSREPVAKYRQTIQDDRQMAAQWMSDYEDAMTVTGKHLTHTDKKWMEDHFKEFYEKQKAMPNERIQGFADEWTKIHNGIGDTAKGLKVQEKYRTSEYVVKDGDRSVRVLDDKVSAEDFIRDHKRGDEFTIEVRDAIKFRPFTKIERYFPHILTPDAKEAMRTQSGEIFDALVQAAHTKGFDLTPYLEDLDIKNLVRRNANLEHARQANMPEYVTTKSGAKVQVLETDPFKVIPASIEGAARRLAFVKNWGPKSTESLATHEQYRNAIAGEAGSEAAGTWDYLWQDMQGRTRDEFTEGMGSHLQKTFNTSEAIARSLMLSMAQVANIITGPVPIMVKYGAKRTAKAYAKLASRQLLTHFGVKMPDTEKALDDFRRMGGWAHDTQKVTGDTESLSQSLGGMADTFLKKTGMEAANRFLNKVSNFSAHGALIDALEGLKKPDNHGFKRMWGESHASLRAFLKREGEWTDEDVDRMIKDGPSDNDVTRFVQRSSTMANVFMERAETRPQFMKNGFWRRVFAYTSYYRMMGSVVSDTMRYAKEGNYRPLMTLVLGAAVLGTAEREIKDYLKGIIKRDNGNSEELNFAGNLLDSLAGSGALAMPGTFINDVKWWTRKGDTPFTMPQVQWWGNVAHGMYNAVKEGLTEDAGAGANQAYYTTVRNVPLFRTLDNMMGGPYKKYLDYKYRNGGSGRRRRRRSR